MQPPIVVVRSINSTPEKVFRAWSQPELLRQWFAMGSSWVELAEVDFRTGGSYRIVIADQEGKNVVFGRYQRIEAPHLIEFTWNWEVSTFEKGESLVTIELKSASGATEMKLTHRRLANETSEQRHTHGWNLVLDRLVGFVSP